MLVNCSQANGLWLLTPLSENAVNGITEAHNFFSPTPTASGAVFSIQQPVTIYVDPGATVKLFVNSWAQTDGFCFLNVNGDLVIN